MNLDFLNNSLNDLKINAKYPNNPTHRNQKYRFTKLGMDIKKKL